MNCPICLVDVAPTLALRTRGRCERCNRAPASMRTSQLVESLVALSLDVFETFAGEPPEAVRERWVAIGLELDHRVPTPPGGIRGGSPELPETPQVVEDPGLVTNRTLEPRVSRAIGAPTPDLGRAAAPTEDPTFPLW